MSLKVKTESHSLTWAGEIAARLPKIEPWTLRNESDFYGASRLIADLIGLDGTPPSEATWAHGWNEFPPAFVENFTWDSDPNCPCVLTNSESEAAFLRAHGVHRAIAVGAAFAYVPDENFIRTRRSLLIVPVHSLKETTYKIDDENYFERLDPFLTSFEHIAACIHPSCEEKGFWLNGLQRRGIPYFVGANAHDSNALRRIKILFSSFSHVTSNWIGSHIPYAAFCGCSVSIFGPKPEFRIDYFKDLPFYQSYPQILRHYCDLRDENFVEREYAWLFRTPDIDANDRDWAAWQLGCSHIRPPSEVARLLGWSRSITPEQFVERAPLFGWNSSEDRLRVLNEEIRKLKSHSCALQKKYNTLQMRLLETQGKSQHLVKQLYDERSKSLQKRLWEEVRARFCRP